MDAAIWGFIGTLTGTVVGASASIFTTLLSGLNATRLQKNVDSLAQIERARSFQRSNLIELQDSILDALRLSAQAQHEYTMAWKKNGEWRKSMLSEEVDQKLSLSNKKLTILSERIAKDELRSELKSLHQSMADFLFASTEPESFELMQKAHSKFELFMEHLGIVLRSYY